MTLTQTIGVMGSWWAITVNPLDSFCFLNLISIISMLLTPFHAQPQTYTKSKMFQAFGAGQKSLVSYVLMVESQSQRNTGIFT